MYTVISNNTRKKRKIRKFACQKPSRASHFHLLLVKKIQIINYYQATDVRVSRLDEQTASTKDKTRPQRYKHLYINATRLVQLIIKPITHIYFSIYLHSTPRIIL